MPQDGMATDAFPALGEQMTGLLTDHNLNTDLYHMLFDPIETGTSDPGGEPPNSADGLRGLTGVAGAAGQASPSFVTGNMMPAGEPGSSVPRNIPGNIGTYTTNTFFSNMTRGPTPTTTNANPISQYNFDTSFGGSLLPVSSTTMPAYVGPAHLNSLMLSTNVPLAPTIQSSDQPLYQPLDTFPAHSGGGLARDPFLGANFMTTPYNQTVTNNNDVVNIANNIGTANAARAVASPAEATSWADCANSFGLQQQPPASRMATDSLVPGPQMPTMVPQQYPIDSTTGYVDGTTGRGGTPLTPNMLNTPGRPITPYSALPPEWGRGQYSGNNNAALLGIRDEFSPATGAGATPESGGPGQELDVNMPPLDFGGADDLVRQVTQIYKSISARVQQTDNSVPVGRIDGGYGGYGGDGNFGSNIHGGGLLRPAQQPRQHRHSFTASDSASLGIQNNLVSPLDTMVHAQAPRSAPVSATGESPRSYQLIPDLFQQAQQQQQAQQEQHHREQQQLLLQRRRLYRRAQLQQQQHQHQQQQQQQQQPEALFPMSALPTDQSEVRRKRPRSPTDDAGPSDVESTAGTDDAGPSDLESIAGTDYDSAAGSGSDLEEDVPQASTGWPRSRRRRVKKPLACLNCYLSRKKCDHMTPCGGCMKSKVQLKCIQYEQWACMENIFLSGLPDKLVATVDAILSNRSLSYMRPDKALEKHTGRTIALKAALDVLSVVKFGKNLSFAAFFEETPARHHTIFGPFYQACIVLQGRRILQKSATFVYTPQFEDDMRVLLALSTTRALRFFDKHLEKNKMDQDVPCGGRAHELVVFLAIVLEQTTQITDLVAPPPTLGPESVSAAEARAKLAEHHHRVFLYHLAYFLRKMSTIAFEKKPKANKKGMAADKATGKKRQATKKGKAKAKDPDAAQDSELKLDKHLHIGLDNDVYLKDTFWISLSKRISLHNSENAEAATEERIRGKGKAVARDDSLDPNVESPESEEEQHVGMGANLFGHADPWVGRAGEGNAGPLASATLDGGDGDGQSGSARTFTVPTKLFRQKPKKAYDNDGLLKIRTEADELLFSTVARSLQEMHIHSESQGGHTGPTDTDTGNRDHGAERRFMCGYKDTFGNWHMNGGPPVPFPDLDQRNSSGSGGRNSGNGNGEGDGAGAGHDHGELNRGDSTYADGHGSGGAASPDSGNGLAGPTAGPAVYSSSTPATTTNDHSASFRSAGVMSNFDLIGHGGVDYPDEIEYNSEMSDLDEATFPSSIAEYDFTGELDFSLFDTPTLMAAGSSGSGDGGVGAGAGAGAVATAAAGGWSPVTSTRSMHGSSLRQHLSRAQQALKRTFRSP